MTARFSTPATAPELLRAIVADLTDISNADVFIRVPGQHDSHDAGEPYLYLTGARVDNEGDLILTAEEADTAIFRPATPRIDHTDLINEARNVLWSAENGGHNGRPSQVRAMLKKLTDLLEAENN